MRREHNYYVYLLTNFTNRVIYTGVTSNLRERMNMHRAKVNKGFTSQYNVWKLVYFEEFGDIRDAIDREKQLKGGPRRKKLALVNEANPEWRDLYSEL
jgi:putative endonuclease